MLKAVLFDFDQTVVNSSEGFRSAEHWLQREIFTFLSLSEWDSFIANYRAYRAKGPADTPDQKCSQWSALCRYHGKEPESNLTLRWQEGYWSRVEKGSTLFPETIHVLKKLKEHFRLGIVTNASSADGKSHRLDRYPQLRILLDELVICGREGIPLKPDPEGFRRILASLDVSADEVIFVGDDLETDIKGARGAGILPVRLRHREINWSRRALDSGEPILIGSLEPLAALNSADTINSVPFKLRQHMENTPSKGANPWDALTN